MCATLLRCREPELDSWRHVRNYTSVNAPTCSKGDDMTHQPTRETQTTEQRKRAFEMLATELRADWDHPEHWVKVILRRARDGNTEQD